MNGVASTCNGYVNGSASKAPASRAMPIQRVDTDTEIQVTYSHHYTLVSADEAHFETQIQEKHIVTPKKIPKIGAMLVGLGGNNGTTFVAGILANKHKMSWDTRTGRHTANFYGSFTQSATAHIGFKVDSKTGALSDVYKPIHELLPMADPIDFEISGWDVSGQNLYEAARRAQVLEPTLLQQLRPELERITPLPAAVNREFIAGNQADRIDNVLTAETDRELVDQLRAHLQDMKKRVDTVVVLWTGNTEKCLKPEIETVEELKLRLARKEGSDRLPASVLYCVAAIEEQVLYINGSPQNTFHPAIVEYARQHGSHLAGSDFKSGQTRFKTVMSDFLIGSGIRLAACASYNHLGNNDGRNLDEPECFESKRTSKSGVLDDAKKSNKILYPEGKDHIDHEVVIKYLPAVGDSKRALDEYTSEIFMNGRNTISAYNVCEDSLLATPLMIDLIILGELLTRLTVDGKHLGTLLSYLSFFLKAPDTNLSGYVVNSFSRQRNILINLLKVAAGILPEDGTLLFAGF
jgi:myo-inositol-1-phosphate synthase